MAELAIYEPKKDKKATHGPDVHQFQSDELDEPATPRRFVWNGKMHDHFPHEILSTKERRRPRKEDMGGCFAPRCTSARSNPHPQLFVGEVFHGSDIIRPVDSGCITNTPPVYRDV